MLYFVSFFSASAVLSAPDKKLPVKKGAVRAAAAFCILSDERAPDDFHMLFYSLFRENASIEFVSFLSGVDVFIKIK